MSSAKHGHALEDKAFKTPKPCAQCNESIWGFGSKHKRCTICGQGFHKKCAAGGMVLPKCPGEQVPEKPDGGGAERRGSSVVTSGGEVVDLANANEVLHQKVTSACETKDYESLKKFVQNKKVVKPMFGLLDANGCTPLQVAVSLGDIVVVDALLAAMDPGDVNAVDKFGNTALHEACKATATKNDRVLEALLGAQGIDATLANADENTALHYFCQKYSTVNCAQLGARMLELGGMPLVLKQNKNRETALHYAMFNPQFRLPMARFLIKATTGELSLGSTAATSTIDPEDDGDQKNTTDDAGDKFLNAQNYRGETALHYGVRMLRPDVVQLLLGAGADHRLKNQTGESARDLAEELIKKGGDHARSAAAAAAITSGDPLPLILSALDNAAYLREWLEQPSMELGKFVGNFVRGGVTRDELSELTESHLNDMGIKSAGPRIRIMKAIKELRKKVDASGKKRKTKKKAAGGATKEEAEEGGKENAEPEPEAPPAQPEFGTARMQTIKAQLEKLQYIKVDAGDWIESAQLEFLEELGSGACGTVMRGVYRHPKDGSVHPVAIKVLKEAETDKETEEFKKEFQILSAVRSPYMVHFFGASLHPQMAMVMELCTKGSVWKVLQTDSGIHVGWPQCLEWGVQLASGVAALHDNNPQIVHRDLKTLNLLLSDNWIIKVCDFGLSRFSTSSNLETLAKMRGTMAYCVPEDHEILTNRGFMDLESYTSRATTDKGLLVASYDKQNDAMTFEKPQRMIVQEHQKRTMIEMSSVREMVDTWAEGSDEYGSNKAKASSGVSLLVTAEHNLYAQFGAVDSRFKTTFSDAYEKMEAGDFFYNSSNKMQAIRQKTAATGGYKGTNKPRTREELYNIVSVSADGAAGGSLALFYELYGYWLGDGSFDAETRLTTFVDVRDVEWLATTLTTLFGADMWRAHKTTFTVLDAQWNEMIGREYGRLYESADGNDSNDDKRAIRALQRLKERDDDDMGGEPRAARAERWAAAKASTESPAASVPLHAPRRAAASGATTSVFDAVSSAAGSFVEAEADTSAKWTAWWVWTLDREAVRRVISGVQRADGARAKKAIWTSSVRFRDELVRLCYQAGYTVRFHCKRRAGTVCGGDVVCRNDMWVVRWCDESNANDAAQFLYPTLQKARGDVREREYTGRVWCFTMPSGFIWTRRACKDEHGVVTKASRALLTGQCPPEAYFGERFSDRSDMYSVAVILWELVNRCIKGEYNRPFYEFPNMTLDFQIIIQVARKGKRPTLPPTTPPAMVDLIQRCWQKERDARPTAAQVRDELLALQAAFEKDPAPFNSTYVGRAAEDFAKQPAPSSSNEVPATPDVESVATTAGDDSDSSDDSEVEVKPADESTSAAAPAAAPSPSPSGEDKPNKLSSSRKGSRRKSAATTGSASTTALSPRSPLADSRKPSKRRDAKETEEATAAAATATNNNNNHESDEEESGSESDKEKKGDDGKAVQRSNSTSDKRRRRVKQRALAKSSGKTE